MAVMSFPLLFLAAYNNSSPLSFFLDRFTALLSKFKLENRKWEIISKTKDYFNIDYSHVPCILEKERFTTINYLQKALGLKGERII